jgi:hypothetical protein
MQALFFNPLDCKRLKHDIMDETSYEIAINVKVPGGWQPFGYFQVGYDKVQAETTFDRLQGTPESNDTALRLELFAHTRGDALLIAQKGCTLDQLAQNTKIVAKDVFKYFSLGDTSY